MELSKTQIANEAIQKAALSEIIAELTLACMIPRVFIATQFEIIETKKYLNKWADEWNRTKN